MVLALFLRWCRLKRTHIFLVRLRLFAVKANANREQNLPSLGNYAEMQLCLFKEEKMGLRCRILTSIRHPRFFLFPLLEKGLSKKGKDRSDVSYFILKGAAFYAERFVHHSKVLYISTENVKGLCYLFEIENSFIFAFQVCSHFVSLYHNR